MKEMQITDIREVEHIIEGSNGICQLAMIDNDKPYSIPMNFGYDSGTIYFHGAHEGRKVGALRKNPEVCVSFFSDAKLNIRNKDVACSYSMKFRSVLAHGSIVFVDDIQEKQRILNIIMKNYTGRDDFNISRPSLENVNIFYLKPVEITSHNKGY